MKSSYLLSLTKEWSSARSVEGNAKEGSFCAGQNKERKVNKGMLGLACHSLVNESKDLSRSLGKRYNTTEQLGKPSI